MSLAVMFWPSSVCAATPNSDAQRAVHLNETGSELYAAGDLTGALLAFERAYALANEPNLLFNIAGCHARLGHHQQALDYYRRFLNEPGADPEGRRRAIQAIQELEAPPPAAAPAAPPAPAASPAQSWEHRVWPLATLGAGILFAGLGAGLYLDGAHDHNEVTSAPGYGDPREPNRMTEVEAKALIDSGDTKKLLGGVGLGLGSALIATHVVLSVWGEREAPVARAELRLAPNGCWLSGSF
jgi:tetratricopeptide (TPR) repeat protein